jgi:hypothetical protein
MLLGHIDLVDRDVVRGWAADTDRPTGAVEVAVIVNGRLVGLARADQARDDLRDSATLGSGLHGIGYAFDPPLSATQDHEVVVRFAEGGKLLGQWRIARAAEAAPAPLPSEPAPPVAAPSAVRAISGALPGEVLNSFVDECTRNSVKGWAASETNPDAVFDISIFVDDRKVAQLTADIPREDLAATGLHGDGARGFFHRFAPPLPNGRETRITVTYARTGVPLNKGDVRLIGDNAEQLAPPAPLPEDEPRLLRPPTDPRGLFEWLGLQSGDEELRRLLSRLDFSGVRPEKIHYCVFGSYPETAEDALRWGTYYGLDHLHELLQSQAFQRRLIPLFLHAYPEKRRLIFVHIPKCAGTDLTFHFRARFPSLDRSLTDPDWTPTSTMLRRIARVVAQVHNSDSIFAHGHINLNDHIATGLIRPADRVFTIIREPFAMAISQINYVLTRFDEDIAAGKAGADTAEWSKVMELGPLPQRMSEEFIKRLTRAALRNEDLVQPNTIGTWLGGAGAQRVVQRLTRYNVTVTDTTRYNEWMAREWGIVADTRWNESRKFVTVNDLATDDVAHLNKITAEDRRLYGTLHGLLESSGKLAITGDDLRGVVVP